MPIKYEGKIEVRQRKVKECEGLRETLEIIYLDFSLERSNLYELILSYDGYRIPDILMPPGIWHVTAEYSLAPEGRTPNSDSNFSEEERQENKTGEKGAS